jgi:hypothetical protein
LKEYLRCSSLKFPNILKFSTFALAEFFGKKKKENFEMEKVFIGYLKKSKPKIPKTKYGNRKLYKSKIHCETIVPSAGIGVSAPTSAAETELYYMDLTLPAASAILASYLATGGLPLFVPFLIAVIGGFAAITSSYVFNDCCDVDIDTINIPDRPLPSSRVSKNSAMMYAFLLLLIAGAAAMY